MKAKILSVILLSVFLAAVSGCRSNTVYNVSDESIMSNKDNLTEEDVKKAIVRAGSSLGWSMNTREPGKIVATLNIRKHMAKVNIRYTTKKYSITYVNSRNLNYTVDEDEGPLIHSNYNGWIQNLDNSIKSQLNTL
ncbi:MAG TPA: hypothetical protein ENJ08_12050 [Gammaproteobacteria bacterium]|nr:hypothetical protein [Gammaproteobacteria bacterium]